MKPRQLIPVLLAGALALAAPTVLAQERVDEEHSRRAAELREQTQEIEQALEERRAQIETMRAQLHAVNEQREAHMSTLRSALDEQANQVRRLEHDLDDLRASGLGDASEPVRKVQAALERTLVDIRNGEQQLAKAQADVETADADARRAISLHERARAELRANLGRLRPRMPTSEEWEAAARPRHAVRPELTERVAQLERAVHEMRAMLERHGIAGERARRAMEELEARRRGSPSHRSDEPAVRGLPPGRYRFGETDWPVRPDGHAVRAEVEELRRALALTRDENRKLRLQLDVTRLARGGGGGLGGASIDGPGNDPERGGATDKANELQQQNEALRKEADGLRAQIHELRTQLERERR